MEVDERQTAKIAFNEGSGRVESAVTASLRKIWALCQVAIAVGLVIALTGGYYIPAAWKAGLTILLLTLCASAWIELSGGTTGGQST